MVETDQTHAPISKLIGLKFTKIEKGTATFEMDVRNELLNSLGTLQGGVTSIMADAAMGIAFGSVIDDDEKFVTLEFKINFFLPISGGHLKAIGHVTNKSRRTGYAECEIYNEEEKLVAKAVSTLILV